METIPQIGHSGAPSGEAAFRSIQVRLPEQLVRRLKIAVAESGSTLQELVKSAIEQYLATEGKAA